MTDTPENQVETVRLKTQSSVPVRLPHRHSLQLIAASLALPENRERQVRVWFGFGFEETGLEKKP